MKKTVEHILKYEDLTAEIRRMWDLKTKAIPVIISADGTISKSLTKYLRNITGKHEIKKQQKTAIQGTAHILREVLIYIYIYIYILRIYILDRRFVACNNTKFKHPL